MKRKTFALLLIACMAMLMPANAARRKVVENDSLGNPKRVIELNDTTIDGKSVTDTLSIMTYMKTVPEAAEDDQWTHQTERGDWDIHWLGMPKGIEGFLGFVFIIVFFGMPFFIVFIVMLFRYKNKQARYRLAEKALASGQPLPEEIIRKADKKDLRSRGITNMALGLGLFIFLWTITEEFGIGAIGILVFCIGAGQYLVDRNYQKEHREE
jgi:hypothetical protein